MREVSSTQHLNRPFNIKAAKHEGSSLWRKQASARKTGAMSIVSIGRMCMLATLSACTLPDGDLHAAATETARAGCCRSFRSAAGHGVWHAEPDGSARYSVLKLIPRQGYFIFRAWFGRMPPHWSNFERQAAAARRPCPPSIQQAKGELTCISHRIFTAKNSR